MSRREDSNLHSSLVLRLHHLASMGHGTSPVAFTLLLHRDLVAGEGIEPPLVPYDGFLLVKLLYDSLTEIALFYRATTTPTRIFSICNGCRTRT